MTEQKHTPEPWRIGRLNHWREYETARETVGPYEVVVDTDNGVYVLASCNYNFPQDAIANARRIVACVNACAGISTEWLESYPGAKVGMTFAMKQLSEVQQQRDQLSQRVVGLQELHAEEMARYQQLQNHALDISKQRDQLRAALEMAVRQNSHDMIMTGEELRECELAIAKAKELR